VQPVRPRGTGGFTLIEALVALAILGGLLALGMPRMSKWLLANKAQAAAGFYADGFTFARIQAVTHNSASRLVLTENARNGQMDWQVDICFPTSSVPCNGESGSWSTTTSAADRDPKKPGGGGFRSVFRAADSLPDSSVLSQTLSPSGATDVYFSPLGWLDPAFSPRLTRIGLAPASGRAGAFPASAVVVTLAGIASKCDPNVPAHDSRRCPP
jgi:type IV fimbrial biogenesis protein FimT